MSHLKERKEKQCLNCNAIIYGRFCHVCGQENVEPKESFLHLVRHFIEDVTHFDGKFFDTLRYLILRPGFLAYEYMRGRRNSYLNPIRMYVFTSAIFFLIYFSVNKQEHKGKDGKNIAANEQSDKGGLFNIGDSIQANFKTNFEKEHVIDSLEAINQILSDSILKTKDASAKEKLINKQKTVVSILKISKSIIGNTINEDTITHNIASAQKTVIKDSSKANKYTFKKIDYKLDSVYLKKLEDSIIKTKDTAVKRRLQDLKNGINKKDIIVDDVSIEETKDDDEPDSVSTSGLKVSSKEKDKHSDTKSRSAFEGFLDGLSENREEVTHKIPQVMFITLPFMALILQLLYRRLKQFYYVNHIIFIVNLYIGVYLLILLELGLNYVYSLSHFGLFSFLASVVSLGTFFYVYKSIRNFYHQGRLKTFIKCLLLYFMFFLVAIISFLIVAALPFSLSH
ncbi:DUF3667 domain-containing protein [Parasediminibacterium paludis]|uniref:DUF3667 domain-containing protein n=1 Tax=Parasediminibacterium paludis TaxID=908966 RepID=A0ABV8PZ27_9BACT